MRAFEQRSARLLAAARNYRPPIRWRILETDDGGATWRDSLTGEPANPNSSWVILVMPPSSDGA